MKRLSVIWVILVYLVMIPAVSSAGGVKKELFRYHSHLTLNPGEKDLFIVEIIPKVFDKLNPNLQDLRFYINNKEIGYKKFNLTIAEEKNTTTLKVLNKGENEKNYSFTAVIPPNLLNNPGLFTVKLDSGEYLVKAKIYGSNDNRQWQYLKDQTLYSIDGTFNNFRLQDIDYDYLRIDYPLKEANNGQLINMEYTFASTTEDLHKTPVKTNFKTTRKKDSSELLIDLKYKYFLTDRLTLDISNTNFYRQAEVLGSNDSKNWSEITQDYLYNNSQAGDKKTYINYNEASFRYLKIIIRDSSNQPLTIKGATAESVPRYYIVNASDTPKTKGLDIYWGQKDLSYPEYDINQLQTDAKLNQYQVYQVSTYEPNPLYQKLIKKEPFSEKFPWVLPATLVLLSLGIAGYIFRSLKEIK